MGELDTSTLNEGSRVFVYRNLRRKCYSIVSRERGASNYGRVIGHAKGLLMKDVKFTVGEKSRQRVIREKRKNVHAGIAGTFVRTEDAGYRSEDIRFLTSTGYRLVRYNPYENPFFLKPCGEGPIHEADLVVLTPRGTFAK